MYLAPGISCVIISLVLGSQAQANPPIVDLGYARYQGVVNSNTQNTEFLGIRFAAPPTGDLRWRKPVVPASETELQLANAQPKMCYQANPGTKPNSPYREGSSLLEAREDSNATHHLSGRQAPGLPPMSEDCLFLNVYSPGPDLSQTVGRKLPIIFWIHGGGYIAGGVTGFGFGGPYDGNELIARTNNGAIVVTIQYRLGLFGFLSGARVRDDGQLNAGLLDQEFALKWVQTHIEKFGGDPENVTIWGESAGAGSVLQHLVANGGRTNPPLFRAGMLSSSYLPPQYPFNHRIPEAMLSEAVDLAGCTNADVTMNCLRDASVEALQAANLQINANAFTGTFAFVPVVDGTFIRERPTLALQLGKVNTKRILTVTNTNEGNLFVDAGILDGTVAVDVGDFLKNLFPTINDSIATVAKAVYASVGASAAQVVGIMTEAIFVCPTYSILSNLHGSVYKAEFAIPPAWHADDVAYYFPAAIPWPAGFPNAEFTKAFVQSFIDFAMQQDPNEKHDSTILPTWPKWRITSPTEMIFNRSGDLPDIHTASTSTGLGLRCAFWQGLAPITGQ